MENVRIINWYEYNETIIHPPAIILLILMIILILFIKKEYLSLPLFVILFFIPDIERVVIAGLDFDMVRILVIFGVIRIILRNEHKQIHFNTLDKTYIAYVIFTSIIFILNRKTSGAIINRFGFLLNMTCFYIILRVGITKLADIIFISKCIILLSIFMAASMIVEQVTGVNPFHIMGADYFTVFREGRFRSQAAIAHPILAGTVGASLLPMVWAVWRYDKRNIIYSGIGLCTCLIITYTSASSGPLMTLGAGLIGLGFWFLRKHMQTVRRGLVLTLIILQIIMKGPIWSLLWRMTIVGGSTGYHRYALFDAFVNRIWEWSIFGLESSAHWGWGLQDVTNMFVRVGLDGGLISLILFIALIVFQYKTVGNVRAKLEDKPGEEALVWSLGALLLAHNVSFIGVSYFGNGMFFYITVIGFLASLAGKYEVDFKKKILSPAEKKLLPAGHLIDHLLSR